MFVAPKSPANGPEWWRFFHELRSYFLASDVWESAGRSHVLSCTRSKDSLIVSHFTQVGVGSD